MKPINQSFTVGFVGNPNCGKTTLFNAFTGARLKVANWPGVTVERIEGEISFGGQAVKVIDLPGIYSLSSYTIEERVTKSCVEGSEIDVIINVVDASSLERNLYLTLQLLELGKPVVLALNMIDRIEERGMEIDYKKLSRMLNDIPVIPVSAKRRTGLDSLLQIALHSCKEPSKQSDNILTDHRDTDTIIKEKYDYIETIMEACISRHAHGEVFTDLIDRIAVHPFWGIPVFLGIMALVFFFTFSIGDFLKGYFETGLELFSDSLMLFLQSMQASPWIISLVINGVVAGVGGILTFLPNLFILFLALAFLEDSGYMARVAYVMNETMAMVGLSGKAFLPMLLGFGCTVPAVMAARTLESMKDRRRTIFITPFMSCSARLPIYVLFSSIFFPGKALLAAYSLYLIGLLVAILAAYILHRGSGEEYDNALLIELPEYKMPNGRTVAIYVWDKVKDYLFKAGTTIFAASIILWLILNNGPSGYVSDVSDSFASMIGHVLVPILRPAGLGSWQIAVALLSGISAKEVVVSSFSVLYGIGNINSAAGMMQLSEILGEASFGAVNAYALMVFCLLYTPCIAAVATIRKEMQSLKWTGALIVFQLVLAWSAAVLVFQIGSRLF